ncbi:MAG: right-handed parallel beta-helix repeat-containing protein, partial [Flavobacterium sp.]
MNFKKVISLLIGVFVLTSWNVQAQNVLLASNYIKSTDIDAVPGVLNMLKEARAKKIKKLVFEKKTYHFYNDRAFSKWCDISNHDSGMKNIAFPILNFDDLEIDGNGAMFIMHGLIVPFAIENSKSIKLANLSIDWDRPMHSELTVVSVDSAKRTVDFHIDKQYPYEIRNGELIFLKKGYEHNLEQSLYWDPKTMAIVFQSQKYDQINQNAHNIKATNNDLIDTLYGIDKNSPAYKYRGKDNELYAQEIEPGLVKITNLIKHVPKVGWILVAKGKNGYNRMAPAIFVSHSDEINLNNVTVHHAPGMGLIAQNSSNINLFKFGVKLNPANKRILTTTADATHFVGCRGKITMDSCNYQNQLDDATNIHGTYVTVKDFKENTAGIYIGHFQQNNFDFARPG